MSGQEEEGAEEDPLLQCMGQHEVPLMLEVLKEEELMIRDQEGGMRDPTNEIRSLQRREQKMRKNTEKLQRTK